MLRIRGPGTSDANSARADIVLDKREICDVHRGSNACIRDHDVDRRLHGSGHPLDTNDETTPQHRSPYRRPSKRVSSTVPVDMFFSPLPANRGWPAVCGQDYRLVRPR